MSFHKKAKINFVSQHATIENVLKVVKNIPMSFYIFQEANIINIFKSSYNILISVFISFKSCI